MSGMRGVALASCALAAGAAALVLPGCGGGHASTGADAKPSGDAKRAVAAAAAKTEQSTAKVHISVVLAKPGQARTAHYVADGKIGPAGGRLEIDRSLLGAGIQHEILVRRSGHLVLYTSPSSIALPAGKSWLAVDLTKYGLRRYGADTTFFAGADQDPFQPLELLGSPAASVRDLGLDYLPDATLNTRYRGRVSLVAAARAAGVKPKGLTQLRDDLGSPTQTIDVWVSKAGRVARVAVEGPAKAPDGSTLRIRSTIDFTAFGTRTTVAAPPTSTVEDYFSLFPK